MSDIDMMPEPPPMDDDWMPPPDEPYFMPDDPFPDDLFSSAPPDYDYVPVDDPWLPDDARFIPEAVGHLPDVPPLSQDGLQGFEPPEPADEGWGWHDARLIGVERDTDGGTRYEIGAIDVYANINTGDLGGSYLPVASFEDVDVAAAFYHTLQEQMHDQGLPAYQVPEFAEARAAEMNPEPENWRGASPEEYAAYEHLRDLDDGGIGGRDEPPDTAIDPLIRTAAELGGVVVEPEVEAPQIADESAFQALNAIGIEAENFDPAKDPPPFYDAETGTAYWIGVFQPDKEDRENCVTSILSLGRNPETGEMEAQLAPCVPGEWDKAYASAEYLIQVAQKGGIDRCFDAAEGMALATDQRELWESERGVALEPDAAKEIADYTRDAWEVDL
ncbi:MAG: hypothetical protein H6672_13280 [Anaerolineaceae bacterium]|nr:hypothetical protein [Anaerolineaceae bacterium]